MTATTTVPLHPLIARRWSPRAWSGRPVPAGSVRAVLEAARWAASANNVQPWRFVVGERGDSTWDLLHDALRPGNQRWADAAPVLVLASVLTVDDEGAARPVAGYELGLAVAQLTLQAHAEGLHVHQMAGFDHDAVRSSLGIPAAVEPYTILALGEVGDPMTLPEDLLARETAARTRRPLTDLAFAQTWGHPVDLGGAA